MPFLVAILTFIEILLVVAVIVFALGGSSARALDRLQERAPSRATGPKHSLNSKLVRDESVSSVPLLNRLLVRWSGIDVYHDFLLQAGMKTKPAKILLLSGVLGLGCFLLFSVILNSSLPAAVIGVAAAFLPTGVVATKRSRRLRAFEKVFPEAIDLLGRAIRAGHAFTSGLEMISKELSDPIAGEFRTTFDEQNFGLPLRDALLNLTVRVPLIDVRIFVTALLVQKETGGNLAELLDNLSAIIRDRFRIMGEVRVRTAQGRLTAMLLIGLPPALLIFMSILNKDYVRVLFTDPMGVTMLGVAALMQVLGSLWIWKVVRIEV